MGRSARGAPPSRRFLTVCSVCGKAMQAWRDAKTLPTCKLCRYHVRPDDRIDHAMCGVCKQPIDTHWRCLRCRCLGHQIPRPDGSVYCAWCVKELAKQRKAAA